MIKLVIDLEKSVPPEGYEFSGEFRIAREEEYYLSSSLEVIRAGYTDTMALYPILRKKRWRAEDHGMYWYVDTDTDMVVEGLDNRTHRATSHYCMGNYFKEQDEAVKYLKKIREVFKGD